jgi:hypothetical protein
MMMLQRVGKCIKDMPFAWLLAVVILFAGIFLRTYHFNEWLLFKGDAFRDAVLVSHVFNDGVGSLPLFGPKAGGTQLHLGPFFYYFQSLAVLLFQDTSAPVLAYPDVLFSILTLPLIFLFVKRYFSFAWALAIMAMLSCSFFAIEYGRFAWNPNSVPFWITLFLYALLRAYDDNESKKTLWAGVAGGALGIASQLHFSTFLGLPILTVLFALWNYIVAKKTVTYRSIAVFFGVLFLIYTPVLLDEWMTHGENTREFFKAIHSKGAAQGWLIMNLWRDISMFGKYSLRILTGVTDASMARYVAACMVIVVGIWANVRLYLMEKDIRKRQFLVASFLLVSVYFLLYIPLAFKIDRPRFFLPFLFMPYVMIGYIFTYAKSIGYKNIAYWGSIIAVTFVVASNIVMVDRWMRELALSQTSVKQEKTLKGQEFYWTWGHFERAAAVMNSRCQNDVLQYTMSKNTQEFGFSIEYALRMGSGREAVVQTRNYKSPGTQGCYFYVSRTGENLSKLVQESQHDESIDAGGIAVTQWYPKDATREYTPDSIGKLISLDTKIRKHKRLTWSDVGVLFRGERRVVNQLQ